MCVTLNLVSHRILCFSLNCFICLNLVFLTESSVFRWIACVLIIHASLTEPCVPCLNRVIHWITRFSAEDLDLEEGSWDIHVITGALKLFFRELQEPLFPYNLFSEFISGISEFMSSCFQSCDHQSTNIHHKINPTGHSVNVMALLLLITLFFSFSCALIQKSLIITVNFHTWKIWWGVCHKPTMTQWRRSSAIYASMLIIYI